VNQGDIILIGLREFQDGKADVILKYLPDEARRLKQLKYLPSDIKIEDGEENKNQETDLGFEFADRVAGSFESCESGELMQPSSRGNLPPSYSDSEDSSDDSVDIGKLL